MLYRLALTTGLRASELASLTKRSFDLDSTPPTVAVEAAGTSFPSDRMWPNYCGTTYEFVAGARPNGCGLEAGLARHPPKCCGKI
jgi:hypothetical protein